jgi:integrase
MLDGELLKAIQTQWERRKIGEIPGQSPTLLCPCVLHRIGKPLIEIRKFWAAACREAGFTGKLLHDFRHTAAINMVVRALMKESQ